MSDKRVKIINEKYSKIYLYEFSVKSMFKLDYLVEKVKFLDCNIY